ncbi:hypothetical protein HPT25_11375 [Bacillus sp. BRMEA1]|uniref:hypothetical protein n=1 Tax=Neobacillus endophyticus TaxID=2738405 RepID=UPI0015670560|nr:hypothetical protein [Neobacillus endophyticus]NRD77985.1 hypothetical protein [Neobacillus endophyticus]
MVFFLIITGYILVIVKLYEGLSLLMLFSVIIGWNFRIKKRKKMKEGVSSSPLLNKLYDLLDGLPKTTQQALRTMFNQKQKNLVIKIRTQLKWSLFIEGIALLVIVSFSFYVRFYDAFVNAAPPLSDSYVTLAWMKYINNRDLFHDGIYPQGFHIYLASIFKFAAVDSLYILRYTGPLNTLMIVVGLYIVVRKLTNNPVGALTAAWIYGIVWVVFPLFSTDRQAATNSQEFAFVFIYPAVYFFMKFFQTDKKEDLYIGILSTAIIGLVHSLGYALIGLMLGMMMAAAAVTLKKSWKPYLQIVVGTGFTGILSVMPLGAGYLLGKGLNASSAAYLTNQNNSYQFAILNEWDYMTIGALGLLLLHQFRRKISREERFIGIFTTFTGLSIFTLYYAGGVMTHSTVIDSRSIDLWRLVIPFCIGISVSYLFNMFKGSWRSYVNIVAMVLMISVTFIDRASPIIPYKLEYNENVEQYLRISQQYLPQTWMIVSQDEGYSEVLGKGFHMHLGDFLKTYNPRAKALTKFQQGAPDKNIPPHVFVFQEKKVFEVAKTNSVYQILAPKYKERAKEYKDFTRWLRDRKQAGYKLKIYYQDQHIFVYQFDIPGNINQ